MSRPPKKEAIRRQSLTKATSGTGKTSGVPRQGPKRGLKSTDTVNEPAVSRDDIATGSAAALVDRERVLERSLGSQIRQLRHERDLSIVELAAAADISVGMASKIENGAISPSLSTLHAVATALHVPFSSLFTSFEEKLDCSFVAQGDGLLIDRRGTKLGHIYELLGDAIGTDVAMEPYLITLEKKAVAYTGFRHAGTELIYLLSGELVYRHAGQDFPMRPGDTLVFDAAALHGPEKIVQAPVTYLSVIVYPKGAAGALP